MTDQRPSPADISAAFRFLTRLPLPDGGKAPSASSVWAFPIVGMVLGASAGFLAWFLAWIGVPRLGVGALTIGYLILITGALHEDGLADCADGFGGGKDKAGILAIMRDSSIGTYGALALMIVIFMRITGVVSFGGWDFVLQLAAVGGMSRALMGGLMFALPNARSDGASASFGKPSAASAGLGLAIGLVGAIAMTGISGALLVGIMALPALGLMLLAKAKIGGQTGDVLGASQQSAESIGLMAAVALLY
ncbi:MAG: adenosylcobinamide-GDP ribazoletransferase [Paracoccaceae bacterium]